MAKLAALFQKIKKIFTFSKQPEKKITSYYFLRIWKKFTKQIPREFRSITKKHQQFILLGSPHSGKSELTRSLVEQSQNIYPFEVEYTKNEDLHLFLGPNQVIQEFSFETIKDRTIKLRKAIIRLWKHQFSKNPPIVIIAHNCWLDTSTNVREVNKFARLIGGKLSLISELSSTPIKVRVSLTHMDKIKGFLEFAWFLKQHNLKFEIPLTNDFQNNILMDTLSDFREKYLSLILTSSSAEEYQTILDFFSELPKLFPLIEEFLRVLAIGNLSNNIELEQLTFSSNQEPYTSFASFGWKQTNGRSIFFRHPMLKHQIAAAGIALVGFSLIINNYARDAHQIALYRKGIDSLIFSQSKMFMDKLLPEIEKVNTFRPQECYLPFLPRFFKKDLREANHSLSSRIHKHIFQPALNNFILERNSEIKTIYMLGLIHASKDNKLGQHILENINSWASALSLDEKLIRAYIQSRTDSRVIPISIEHCSSFSPSTPLSDLRPWLLFMREYQSIINQPVFTGHNFDFLRQTTSDFLSQLRMLKGDPHAFAISSLLEETNSTSLQGFEKNIKALRWLERKQDSLEKFLLAIYQSSPPIPEVADLNISQFFVKIKEIAKLTLDENLPFTFDIEDELFKFETKDWNNLAATHVIERMIKRYTVANRDTQGNIFFNHTPDIQTLEMRSHRSEFPYFPEPVIIEGRFTRDAFEKNVRNTCESIFGLLEEMPIIPEDRQRLVTFITEEVISYAKEYQENYESLYAACNIKTRTLEEVRDLLTKIISPTSNFEHFLNTIKHHTSVFSETLPESEKNLSILNEINHFDFLLPFLKKEPGKISPFQKYQEMIQKVLNELTMAQSSSMPPSPLTSFLSPAGNISLGILKNDPLSYVNQIKDTLTENGVPEDYHFLFLSPISRIHAIGIHDLKVGIQKLWTAKIHPDIELLFQKRPFNPHGEDLATLEEVTKLTNPKNEFYRIIEDIISPLSDTNQGVWVPKGDTAIQLEGEIYSTFNRLAKISRSLWDSQGNYKPLEVIVQSLPFEPKKNLYPAPIISYLVSGSETLYNFNQNPQWLPLKIEWWKQDNSTVVMELINKNESRSYRGEKVTNTLWSFFELLRKAKKQADSVWEWELANGFGDDMSQISLEFKQNPWEIFQ